MAVLEVAKQVWKYLRKTRGEGIWFKKKSEDEEGGQEDEGLEVFTDSSYGPGGLESQGTVIVMFGKGPVMWRSGRQSIPALSTAESELNEAIEGLVMGDAVDVVCDEITTQRYAKVIKIDNLAALSLLSEPTGSWRTRHLRLRSTHI